MLAGKPSGSHSGKPAGGTEMEKPKRAFEVKIEIGADDWEGVVHNVRHLAFEMESRGHRELFCGGSSSSYSLQCEHRPEMDHDRYHKALKEYLKALKEYQESGVAI
jgi:hypothetical protein